MKAREDRKEGRKPGMALERSVSHVQAVNVLPRQSYQGNPENPSASLLGPYRGICGRLAKPDPELAYTLEGEVWSMDQVKTLQTAWFLPVEDILDRIKYEIKFFGPMYAILRESMEEYGQRVPVHISDDKMRLRDGIHRIAIADDLGWNTVLVSTDIRKWHEWDESARGQEYHIIWRQRLGMGR
jgi:hypothetical protein